MSTQSIQDIASKIYDPGLFGIGKAYLSKPSEANPAEFLPFTRAGSGSTTVQNGKVVNQAANVPAIAKRQGECARHLFRPSRTNLFLKSIKYGNATWQKTSSGTGSAPIVTENFSLAPNGTLTANRIQFNTGAGGSSSDISILQQAYNQSLGQNYTISFWMRSNTGSDQSIQLRGDSTPLGVPVVVTPEWQNFSEAFTGGSTASRNAGLDLRGNVGTTADVLVWIGWLEVGTYSTDSIETDDTTITRSADTTGVISGLKASGYIGNSAGSIGGQLAGRSLLAESNGFMLTLGSGGGEYLAFRRLGGASASRISVIVGQGGLPISINLTTQDINKWLLSWDPDGWHLSINGSVVASGSEVLSFPSDSLSLTGTHGLWELNELVFAQVKLNQANANIYTTI